MAYLLSFGLSLFFAYGAKHTKNKLGFLACSILSIFIPAALAGLRGLSVGIDTSNYFTGETGWAAARASNSFSKYLKFAITNARTSVPEVLFLVLLGFIQKTTGSYNLLLFVISFISVGCVYIGAFRMRERADPLLTLYLFFLLYFGQSLNIMRQYMAMAILFAFFQDIEEKKYIRYLIVLCLCFFIHNSAVLGLLPLLLDWILYPGNKKRSPRFRIRNSAAPGLPSLLLEWNLYPEKKERAPRSRKLFISICVVVAMEAAIPLIYLLIQKGVIRRNFLWYLKGSTGSYTLVLLFLLVEVISVAFFWRKYKRMKHYELYVFCTVAFISLTILGRHIMYGDRLAEYFSLINLGSIGMIEKCQTDVRTRQTAKIGIAFVGLFYWFYVYLLRNASDIMPYVIEII